MSCELGSECGCGFKNTGMKYPEVWDKFNRIIDEDIGCEECNIHGHENMNGLRDHTKAGIGGTVFDKKNYRRFANEVACVLARCTADGRC